MQEEFQDDPNLRDKNLEEEERYPISTEVRKSVEFTYRHLSTSKLLRMMRLSGASSEAIRYAKRWRCDVCAQRQRPRHPMASTATTRPYEVQPSPIYRPEVCPRYEGKEICRAVNVGPGDQ